MSQAALARSSSVALAPELRRKTDAAFRAWAEGERPDALVVLNASPELWQERSAVIDLAYEEFCLRRQAGETIDLKVFCASFNPYHDELFNLLDAHQNLEGNPHLLEDSPVGRFPEPGERFGDFTIVRELGRGAFAHVYLATDAATGDRPVALKFSLGSSTEARTLGRLVHPNVVPVWSARRDPESNFLVVCMPFLGSATLNDVLHRTFPTPSAKPPRHARVILDAVRATSRPEDPPLVSDLTEPRLRQGTYVEGVLRLGMQLAEALAFLHERGVCHHDLKPSNVLLSPGGRPLLLDFNLAEDKRETRRRKGGSVPYVAPEQARGLLDPSHALLTAPTDLYDLGLILYELLTGKHPFGPIPRPLPKTSEELAPFLRVLLERQQTGPPPLRSGNPKVSRAVAQLIERCLAFDPAKRPDAATLAAGLRRHFARPRWSARRRLVSLAASLLVIVATAGVLAVNGPSPERDFRRGQEALRAGDWSEADRYFDRVLQTDPSRADAWFARGRAQLATGGLGSAMFFFKKADPSRRDGPTLVCLAYCLAAEGHHEPALLTLKDALALPYKSAALYNNRAYSLLNWKPPSDEATKRKALDEAERAAERALEEALRLNPDLPEARYNRAILAKRRSLPPRNSPLPSRAIEDIRFAVASLPPSASLLKSAAEVCALASGPEAPDRDEIFDLLRRSVALGAKADWILRKPYRQRMVGYPGLPELLKTKPGNSSPISEPGLASPLTGLPD